MPWAGHPQVEKGTLPLPLKAVGSHGYHRTPSRPEGEEGAPQSPPPPLGKGASAQTRNCASRWQFWPWRSRPDPLPLFTGTPANPPKRCHMGVDPKQECWGSGSTVGYKRPYNYDLPSGRYPLRSRTIGDRSKPPAPADPPPGPG